MIMQDVQKKLAALDFEHKAAAMSKEDFNTWVKDNAFTCMGGACAIGGESCCLEESRWLLHTLQ